MWGNSRDGSYSGSLSQGKTKENSSHAKKKSKYLLELLQHPHKKSMRAEMNIKEAVGEHAAQCSSSGNIDAQWKMILEIYLLPDPTFFIK